MALHISYKPGEQQSLQAARYFHEAVEGLVATMVEGLDRNEYTIPASEGAGLLLRIWSADALDDERLHDLFDRILAVRADLQKLRETPDDPQCVVPIATNWLAEHLGGADLYLELSLELDGEAAPTPEFSMALMRGRSVMISTDTLFFSWLERDVFGLTLAGHGSYLLEVVEEQQRWPKAS
ncbi:MAG: hypothetical protein H6595_11785 [Flavobacteriales bacterium]|nr:hypothetical protein [Flavobacteriales bacterium]MCB9168141.1 hypothetical protein [Flavobacteriales bacterium]MCB9194294.1 hypothetical protein [Flavobacteriales bacterium]